MTDAELDALAARLMRSVVDTTAFCPEPQYRNPDGPEAATALTTLRKALKHAAWELTDKGHDREAAVARQALSNIEEPRNDHS